MNRKIFVVGVYLVKIKNNLYETMRLCNWCPKDFSFLKIDFDDLSFMINYVGSVGGERKFGI